VVKKHDAAFCKLRCMFIATCTRLSADFFESCLRLSDDGLLQLHSADDNAVTLDRDMEMKALGRMK